MFTKKDRSSFPYWFAHWSAFQMTALNLHAWKFKYLFHDFEKPWLKLFLPYEKVQKIHRRFSKHHFSFLDKKKNLDYEAMVIDWECSRFTKSEAQLNAFDTYKVMLNKTDEKYKHLLEINIPPILKRLKLWEEQL